MTAGSTCVVARRMGAGGGVRDAMMAVCRGEGAWPGLILFLLPIKVRVQGSCDVVVHEPSSGRWKSG